MLQRFVERRMSHRVSRVAARLALLPLAVVMSGCPEPEDPCAGMCHAGEVQGPPPDCECGWPGDFDPPITQGPEGQRVRGTVRLVGVAGYGVERVTADISSVSVSGSHEQVGRVASSPHTVEVLGNDLAHAGFRVTDVAPVVNGLLETTNPSLNVRWSGPVRIVLRSPDGGVSALQFDVPASSLPVRVTRVSGDVLRLDGDVLLGPARLSLVAFLEPGEPGGFSSARRVSPWSARPLAARETGEPR